MTDRKLIAKVKKMEPETIFALELLMPFNHVRELWNRGYDVKEMAYNFAVSTELMVMRLNQCIDEL